MASASRRGRRWTGARVAGALLLVALGALLLAVAQPAAGETGAPALEPDNVWRARGDWVVESGDRLLYADATIEVWGNLTVEAGGELAVNRSEVVFTNLSGPRTALKVAQGGTLVLDRVTVRAMGPGDLVRVEGGNLTASDSTLAFLHAPGVEAAIEVDGGSLRLTSCTVSTSARLAVGARNATFHTTDADFITPAGADADLLIGGNGSYLFDTTRFDDLFSEGAPSVTAYATVRFLLLDPSAGAAGGKVNGTGAFGEFFFIDTAPPEPSAMRLKWFELSPAPPLLASDERLSPQPVRFTAVNATVGANTSSWLLASHRANITVVLDRTYDIAVASFTVIGRGLEGPNSRRAYYVELNTTVDIRVRVENRGVGQSPAATLVVARLALEAQSWSPYASREELTIELPPLEAGAGANYTFSFLASPYGGKDELIAECYERVSYASGLRVAVLDSAGGDFGAWNDERSFTLIAFRVTGNESAECARPGADFLPYLALGGGGALAAAVLLTRHYSDENVMKRAARASRAPPEGHEPPVEPPPPRKS